MNSKCVITPYARVVGFESQKARYAALASAGIVAFVVIAFIYLAAYALTFALFFAIARTILLWIFDRSAGDVPWWLTAVSIAGALAGTAIAGRVFDRAVMAVRRRRGKPTTGRHAASPREAAGDVLRRGVDWIELVMHLVILVPALVGSVYLVGYTVNRWIDLPTFVLLIIAVLLATAISYPLLQSGERLLRRWTRGTGKLPQSR